MKILNRQSIDALIDEHGCDKMIQVRNDEKEKLCLADLAFFYDGQELEIDILEE